MMVCPVDDAKAMLISQVDHSHVAGLLAAHWGNEQFAPLEPYASMVLAAQEHDSGWWDWEIRPTLGDDGRPLDYIGSTRHLGPAWIDFYRHGISRVAAHDLYAAYFVSAHGEGLATQGMGLLPKMPALVDEPGFTEFITEQQAWRKQVVETLRARGYGDAVSDEQMWRNYNYMQVFDQLAQFVCNRHPFDSTARRNGPTPTLSDLSVPVAPGRDPITLTVSVEDETSAVVTPYPFDVDPLVIHYQGRIMDSRPFASQEEFLAHFYRAEIVPITRTLRSA